jgi:hypothetical protein
MFDPARMKAACRAVIARHPILRTVAVVPPRPYDEIVHVVLTAHDAEFAWYHHAYSDRSARDAAVQAHLNALPGFAMNVVPTRVALFNSPESSVLIFQLHHSQYDGWSLPRILEDVQDAYSEHSAELGPITPYSHFVQWVRSQNSQASIEYWNALVAGTSPSSWPPTSRSSYTAKTFVQTFLGGQRIVDHCAASEVTMSSFVRTAVALVLGVYSGSDDVTFGVIVSGRTGDLEGLSTIVGSCISTYPCRVRLDQRLTIQSLLAKVHEQSIESIPHQCVGLGEIKKTKSLFNVVLAIENLPRLHETEHPFFGKLVRGHSIPVNYPLSIAVFPSEDRGQLRLHVGFDPAVLQLETVELFAGRVLGAFERMLSHPEERWDEPSLRTRQGDLLEDHQDRTAVIAVDKIPASQQYTNTMLATQPQLRELHLFIQNYFETIVKETPDAVALKFLNEKHLSYAELDRQSNLLANQIIREFGVKSGTLVLLFFDKCIEMIVALLAVVSVVREILYWKLI